MGDYEGLSPEEWVRQIQKPSTCLECYYCYTVGHYFYCKILRDKKLSNKLVPVGVDSECPL